MRKIFFLFLFALLLSTINFSQTATRIDEIPYYASCGDIMDRLDIYYRSELKDKPQNKLYVIYYEGRKTFDYIYNPKTRRHKRVLANPTPDNALNRAKEIPLYLNMKFGFPTNNVFLIDGGFREKLTMEIWSVPDGALIPKATPTVKKKQVKFSKKKPERVRDLIGCYS